MNEAVAIKSFDDGQSPRFEYSLDGHLNQIQNCLYSQWLEGIFCDLKLQTQDGSIHVHTCLMAAFSPRIATTLHSHNEFNHGRSAGTFSLNIAFKFEIVKTIVEAIYSGCFSAAIENLHELQAALQWFEMNELLQVVTNFQVKAEKEKFFLQHIDAVPSNSIRGGRRKSLRKPVKARFFLQQKAHCPGVVSNEVSRTVPVVDDVPLSVSVDQKEHLLKSNVIEDVCEMEVGNSEVVEEHHNDATERDEQEGNEGDDIPENNAHLSDIGSSPLQEARTENVEPTVNKSKGREKAAKKVKERKKDSKSSKKKTDEERKAKKLKNKKSKGKKKSKVKITSPPNANAVLQSLLPTFLNEEEEKKKDATEALMIIGGSIVKEEPAEYEEFESVTMAMEEAMFRCGKCKIFFASIDELNCHMEDHPTFTCENCFMVFYSRSLYTRHIRGMHLKSMHLKCSQCSFSAGDNDKLYAQHCIDVHQNAQPFKCMFDGCKYKTKLYRNLSSHFERHESMRTCVCENCHKTFARYALLYSHRRSCYDVQKYLCDICGQSFNHSSSMQIHRRTMHLGEKPHKCQICTRCFSNRGNLRRHMRIHDNSFPYSCNICVKQFRHSNTLKQHMSKHKEDVDTNSKAVAGQVQADLDSMFPLSPSKHDIVSSPSSSHQDPVFTSSLPSVLSVMSTNTISSQAFSMMPVMAGVSAPGVPSFSASLSSSHEPAAIFHSLDNQQLQQWLTSENAVS